MDKCWLQKWKLVWKADDEEPRCSTQQGAGLLSKQKNNHFISFACVKRKKK